MLTLDHISEVDPDKKDLDWADNSIQHYREAWHPIVDPKKAKDGMEYLLSEQPVDRIKEMFKDPEKSGVSFIRIAAMEKLRNILIAERDKAGIHVELNAIDPSVVDESRKKDKALLKNRKAIEGMLTTLRAKIGEPPYKLQNEKFEGNVEHFDEIGLDDEDDEDVNYFFSTHWRLLQEIKGQLPLNYFVKYNELQTFIAQWSNDILAKKAIAAQAYVNQTSGAIQYEYLAPEQVKAVWGKRKDFKDAQALGYEQNVTVHQLLRHLGDEFDPIRDYEELINAINFTNNHAYTGLHDRNGNVLYRSVDFGTERDSNNYCTWSDFNTYKVPLGYIEFKSIDCKAAKLGVSRHGNLMRFPLKKLSAEVESEHYSKKIISNEVTYKAYFIPTSGVTQRVYKFGKLFHQTVEGGEDELSNFSICCYLEVGPTAVEVAKPYIEMINQAWAKLEWMVRKAKPDGRTYNYESLVQIATSMFAEGSAGAKVLALLQMFEDGINDIYVIPTVDGQRVGGGGNPYYDKKNGISSAAKDFVEMLLFAFSRIENDLGLNGLMPYTPSPNDGYKLQMQQVAQSRNATEYMSTMILNCLRHISTQTLMMVQDIVKYKSTVPYRFLVNALGQDTVNALSQTGFAHARLGIFVETFNVDLERENQKRLTQDAFLKGELDYEQMLLINSIDDWKTAGMRLAYEKKKAEKRKLQEQQLFHKQKMEEEQIRINGKLAEIDRQGQWADKREETGGLYYERAHKATADAMIERKQMEIDNQADKIDRKTEGDIRKNTNKENLRQQSGY